MTEVIHLLLVATIALGVLVALASWWACSSQPPRKHQYQKRARAVLHTSVKSTAHVMGGRKTQRRNNDTSDSISGRHWTVHLEAPGVGHALHLPCSRDPAMMALLTASGVVGIGKIHNSKEKQ